MSQGLNLARFDLTTMRLVITCAKVGSVTHAAPLCHMSVMCASRRIQRLEESVGAVLFYRRRFGLEITEPGKIFVEKSEEILEMVEGMLSSILSAPPPIGKIFENGKSYHTQSPGA